MLDVVVVVQDSLPRLGIQAALEASRVARVVASLDDVGTLDAVLEEHEPQVLRAGRAFPARRPGRCFPAWRASTLRVVSSCTSPHTAEQCALRHLLSAGGRAQLSPAAANRIDECCLTSLEGRGSWVPSV